MASMVFFPHSRILRSHLLAAALVCSYAGASHAFPTGPQAISGTAAFIQSASTLTISNSNNAILNWQQFNIAASEAVRFNQPSASSSVLNRVLGADPSTIYGKLSSNGRVWLVNPAGILVGPNARIDTAGFVASTLNLRNEDFLAGKLTFGGNSGAGSIVNQGAITTPDGGSVYLIAPNVVNQGLISTPKGETILAAGQTVKLIDTATPGVSVEVTGAEGNATNLGSIVAEAGRIGVTGILVKNSGTLNASSVVSRGGRIFLKAAKDAYVDKNAKLTATGTKGGSIEVLGNRIAVTDQAQLDASGRNGGGSVLVGGDYQGKNPKVQNAYITYFGPQASLRADAIDNGNGGKVIVWADDTTRFHGAISAQGGKQEGNGGFVETSGKNTLMALGSVKLAAPRGKGGIWLLDPNDISIDAVGSNTSIGGAGWDSTADSSVVSNTLLGAALTGGATINVQTITGGVQQGTITVNSTVTSAGAGTLNLNAQKDIVFTATGAIAGGGVLNLNLNAGMDVGSTNTAGTNVSAIAMDIAASITTGGGNVSATAKTSGITLAGINTGAGTLTVASNGGAVTQNAALQVGGTSSFNAGAAAITLSNAGNDFGGAVSLTNTGANNVQVTDVNALALGTSAIGGSLAVTASGAVTTSSISAASNITLDATSGDITVNTSSPINTSGGALNLYTNGAVVLNSPVILAGGFFTVAGTGGSGKAASFSSNSSGTITTTGAADISGGNVTIGATGAIVTQAMTTGGGSATNVGRAGGNVALHATDGAITAGPIDTGGSAAANGVASPLAGGSAGLVTVQVDTPTAARSINVGAITAKGGAGGASSAGYAGGAGGAGGNVSVSTTSNGGVGTAAIDTSGGVGGAGPGGFAGGAGGLAGTITVRSFGASNNTAISGDLASAGGTGGAEASATTGAGGNGGTFIVSSDQGSLSMLAFNQGGGQAGAGGTPGAAGTSAIANTITAPAGVTVNAGSGAIKLSDVTVSNGGGAATGPITLIADRMALGVTANTVTAGAGTLWLKPGTASWNIDLGSATDAAASTLELSAAELNTLTGTGALRIGAMTAGNLNLSGAISPTGGYSTTGTLSLEAGGTMTQANSANILTASKLAIRSYGDVTLDTAPNMVGQLSASIGNASNVNKNLLFKNGQALIVGNIDSLTGIVNNNFDDTTAPTSGGIVSLTTTAGTLTQDTGATLSVKGVNAVGYAGVNLPESNPTGVIAGSSTTGSFIYHSTNAVAVSQINGTSGITANDATNGNVKLRSDHASGISQAANMLISSTGLALQTVGPVNLPEANAVTNIAASLTGTGGFLLKSINSNLEIGTVLSIAGISTTGNISMGTTGNIVSTYSGTALTTTGSLNLVAGWDGSSAIATPTVVANTGDITLTDAKIHSDGAMSVSAGNAIAVNATAVAAGFESAGNQTIKAKTITLSAGATANNQNASLISSGTQAIGAVQIALYGGGGGSGYNNDATIYQGNASGSQNITISGGGSMSLQGGSGLGMLGYYPSTCTDCVSTPQSSHNVAEIVNKGSGGQTIDFLAGGTIALTGGTLGNHNYASINNATSSLQKIGSTNGAANYPSITLIGGASGGIWNTTDNIGLHNGSEIFTSNTGGSQIIQASSISLTGGGDSSTVGGAFIGGGISQNITTTGNVSLTGGSSNVATPGEGYNIATAVGIGGKSGISMTVSVGGNLNLAGGTGTSAPAIIGSPDGGATGTLTVTGTTTITPGTSTALVNVVATTTTSTAEPTTTTTSTAAPTTTTTTVVTTTTTTLAPTIDQCVANPTLPGCTTILPPLDTCTTTPTAAGCSAVLPPLSTCTANPTAAGCSAVLPPLDTCTTNPTAAGCSAVLPPLSTCTATPSVPGCSAVLPPLDTCTTNPSTAGCTAVLPPLSTCTTTPTAPGCSAVLPPLSTCTTNPTTAGCSAVLPPLSTCTANPTAAGCSAVLPPLSTCTTTPSAPGCSAVLPPLDTCTTNPSTAGCTAVLPPLSTCTTTPTAPGCSAVLPPLSTCTTNPTAAGCSAVLPPLSTCTANPTAAGCSAVLPPLSTCITNPTTAGCSAVLPPLSTCTATPSVPGCSAVLPPLDTCTTNPSTAGCTAVLPPLSTCTTTPTAAGCAAVLPTIASCATDANLPGCSVVLPPAAPAAKTVVANEVIAVTELVSKPAAKEAATTAPPPPPPPPMATSSASGPVTLLKTNQTIGGTEGTFGGSTAPSLATSQTLASVGTSSGSASTFSSSSTGSGSSTSGAVSTGSSSSTGGASSTSGSTSSSSGSAGSGNESDKPAESKSADKSSGEEKKEDKKEDKDKKEEKKEETAKKSEEKPATKKPAMCS